MAAVVPPEAATSAVSDDSGQPSMQINSESNIDMAASDGAAAQSSCDVSTPAEARPGAKAKSAAMMNKRANMGGRIQPPRGQSTTQPTVFVFAAKSSGSTRCAQHPAVALLKQVVGMSALKQVKRQLPQSRQPGVSHSVSHSIPKRYKRLADGRAQRTPPETKRRKAPSTPQRSQSAFDPCGVSGCFPHAVPPGALAATRG